MHKKPNGRHTDLIALRYVRIGGGKNLAGAGAT